jgi:hypothetical protein
LQLSPDLLIDHLALFLAVFLVLSFVPPKQAVLSLRDLEERSRREQGLSKQSSDDSALPGILLERHRVGVPLAWR